MKQVSRARLIAFYSLAGILTLLAGAEMVNHIIMDTYSPHLMHSMGHLLVSGVVFVAIAMQLWSPSKRIAGVQTLIVLSIAVGIGLALSWYFTEFVIAYLVIGLLLAALHPARGTLYQLGKKSSWLTAVVGSLGAVGFISYALGQAAIQRAVGFDLVHGAHWSLMAAVTIIIPLLALLGAAKTKGWRVAIYGAVLGAVLLGGTSLVFNHEASAFSTTGAIAAIAWAVVLLLVAERKPSQETESI